MIANAAFVAALTVFLCAGWLAGELRFLAPYKTVLFHEHAALIGGAALILFLNLTSTYYSVARWLFLRDTGGDGPTVLLLHDKAVSVSGVIGRQPTRLT